MAYRLDKTMEDRFVRLTTVAYKTIEHFPESDPIKHRAKDRALSIMDGLVTITGTDGWASMQRESVKVRVLEDIDILLGYLWIAKSQGWLGNTNYLIISSEYNHIKKEIGSPLELTQRIPFHAPTSPEVPGQPKPVKSAPIKKEGKLPDRQEKIVKFLSSHQKAQVMDLLDVLPGVTKRTIRRDLDDLLGQGKIVRMGEFNSVFYKLG